MKIRVPVFFIAMICLASPARSQEDLSKLEQSARAFIKAFNDGDAKGIASLFVPDGELVLDSGELIVGRSDLEAHYSAVFADQAGPKAALETGSVRFLTEDLAVEDGTVHLTSPDGEISSHFYNATHVRQKDGSWLFASVRDEIGDHALPSEKLLALGWLIGDWLIQTEGGDTWISFSWSKDGPYIDAKALTESPDGPATSATMRIGWNEKEEAFASWAFDVDGGFNHSTWTKAGPDQWLLKTEGVTSTGETNVVTQALTLDPSGEGFAWTKRDQIIGGIVQDDSTIQVVKRPPAPLVEVGENE